MQFWQRCCQNKTVQFLFLPHVVEKHSCALASSLALKVNDQGHNDHYSTLVHYHVKLLQHIVLSQN